MDPIEIIIKKKTMNTLPTRILVIGKNSAAKNKFVHRLVEFSLDTTDLGKMQLILKYRFRYINPSDINLDLIQVKVNDPELLKERNKQMLQSLTLLNMEIPIPEYMREQDVLGDNNIAITFKRDIDLIVFPSFDQAIDKKDCFIKLFGDSSDIALIIYVIDIKSGFTEKSEINIFNKVKKYIPYAQKIIVAMDEQPDICQQDMNDLCSRVNNNVPIYRCISNGILPLTCLFKVLKNNMNECEKINMDRLLDIYYSPTNIELCKIFDNMHKLNSHTTVTNKKNKHDNDVNLDYMFGNMKMFFEKYDKSNEEYIKSMFKSYLENGISNTIDINFRVREFILYFTLTYINDNKFCNEICEKIITFYLNNKDGSYSRYIIVKMLMRYEYPQEKILKLIKPEMLFNNKLIFKNGEYENNDISLYFTSTAEYKKRIISLKNYFESTDVKKSYPTISYLCDLSKLTLSQIRYLYQCNKINCALLENFPMIIYNINTAKSFEELFKEIKPVLLSQKEKIEIEEFLLKH